jgi:hypothetical protein
MADYKELLRKAIAALPENNGAARRAVYEKARAALVGQLRAIQPPLPARDITQHRLQLEDCIRQVEQEASESVITLARNPEAPSTIEPEPVEAAPEPMAAAPQPEEPVSIPSPEPEPVQQSKPEPRGRKADKPQDKGEKGASATSIEDIIEAAASANDVAVSRAETDAFEPESPVEPEPTRGGRNESIKLVASSPTAPAPARAAPPVGPTPGGRGERRIAAAKGDALATAARLEPSLALAARAEPMELGRVEPALSSVREVDLEGETREAEGAIERAIRTLDRAARGEDSDVELRPVPEGVAFGRPLGGAPGEALADEDDEAAPEPERKRSSSGLTIFLIVFLLLLGGVGGAGYWAVREGYVDLDQMFGRSTPVAQTDVTEPAATGPTLSGPANPPAVEIGTETATGPGNTTTDNDVVEPTAAIEGLVSEDRLSPTEAPPAVNGERLNSGTEQAALTDEMLSSVDPEVLAGSQSLLLEAAEDGRSGATPFSGTVEWRRGTDEVGLPTLIAQADIPARNLSVTITIRRNSDPALPASHLMELDFRVPDTFVGGGISGLPGILLKNQELVQGTPLIGASARVVGNSFLFALSASANDIETNRNLLAERRWMDLAVIYSTGRRAIITLEKDDGAMALFQDVFAEWRAADAG